jgi:serine/threonine protein phosphatase PrpC
MSNTTIRVTVDSDKGKWKRRYDEYLAYLTPDDQAVESTHGTILVLADGQGGNINSNLCAKISVESMIEFYEAEDSKVTIENRLFASFQKVHLMIKEKAESFHTPGMICALTAVVIKENTIWVGQLGNNSLYLVNSKNELNLLNTKTDSYIGQEGDIIPLIQKKELDPGTRILLVSDGISDELSVESITKACSHGTPSAILHTLIQQGNDAGGNDNMTACLIEMGKFSKKIVQIHEKEPVPVKRSEKKPASKKNGSSFFLWILILIILVSAIFLVSKFYPYLKSYLFPGTDKSVNEVVVKPPDIPPVVKVVPEASLLVSVTPKIVTVFFYEGEVPLNEKQKNPIFSSESTPTIIKGLRVGLYTLIIGKEGYEPYRQVIQIKDTDLTKQIRIDEILKPIEKEPDTPKPPIEPIIPELPQPPTEKPVEVLNELTIQSEPTGAKIFVNGAATGLITPNVIKKKPGVYLIQLMKDGYESSSRSVDLSGEFSKQTIYLTLKALPVSLTVTSQPGGAKIYLDNNFTSLYTPATLSLSLGSHTIMVGKAGFEEQSITITVNPGIPLQPLSFVLKRKPGTNRIIDYWVIPYED